MRYNTFSFKIVILSVLLLLQYHSYSWGQLSHVVVGTYKGETAQGMTIWEDNAYLFSNGGRRRILDLRTDNIVGEFLLASANKNNHANTACFGKEYVTGSSVPVIYISQCVVETRCFVEAIKGDSSVLVQTIQARRNGRINPANMWLVDTKNDFIYSVRRHLKPEDESGNVRHVFIKYRLPKLADGKEVVLSEKDELDRFELFFPNLLQGGKIRGRYMYFVAGLQQSDADRIDAGRVALVIDLKEKKIKKIVDLTYLTTNEPEDLDYYKGKFLVYTGQQGGLYRVKL